MCVSVCVRVLECNCLAALHPFGCTRHSRCAALALSFSPTLARSLSLTLSFSLALWSFSFFPSKLWQVGVDSDADADFAAICYLLVQPLVNEAATQQHPIANTTPPPPKATKILPSHPLPLWLLLSSSWQLHCLQCTSPVGEAGKASAVHCACPCLHYVHASKTSRLALVFVAVCVCVPVCV